MKKTKYNFIEQLHLFSDFEEHYKIKKNINSVFTSSDLASYLLLNQKLLKKEIVFQNKDQAFKINNLRLEKNNLVLSSI